MTERRRRRWLRWLGWGVLGGVAVVALALVGGLGFLASSRGSDWLTGLAEEKANAAIAGSVDLEGVDYRGNRLVVRGVTLKDPDGEVVAEVERLDVSVALWRLVTKTVQLRWIRVEKPRLYVVQDATGSNLQRAIAPREEKPEEPAQPKEASSIDLVLAELTVRDGALVFEQVPEAGAGATRTVRVDALRLDGSARAQARSGGERLDASMNLGAHFAEPLEGPIAAHLTAHGEGENRQARLELNAAGAALRARAEMAGETELLAVLEALHVPPEAVRAFVPDSPLISAIQGKGELRRKGTLASLDLELLAGGGALTAKGSFDTAAMRSDGVTVALRDLDLARLLENGPRSKLAMTAHARGGGKSAETLDGVLTVRAPPSPIASATFGPIRIDARAGGGRFRVPQLFVALPGAKLTGDGEGSLDLDQPMSVRARLELKSLRTLATTLGSLVGPPPSVSGSGELNVVVRGPVKAPSVEVKGQFPSLFFEKNAIRQLSLAASVPDVKSPLVATLTVTAKELDTGGRAFRDAAVRLVGDEKGLAFDAGARGNPPVGALAIGLRGVPDADRQGLRVHALTLRYPGVTWTLARPSNLKFGQEELSAEPLRLVSGDQVLQVGGSKRGERIRAEVLLERLDLSKLPALAVDRSLKLAGRLSANVQARGTPASPDVNARVSLADGAFRDYRGLAFNLDAGWAKEHARGKLDASGLGLKLDGDFDVPVRALQKGRNEKVHLALRLHEVELKALRKVLQSDEAMEGKVAARVTLSGTGQAPKLETVVEGTQIRYQQLPPTDLKLFAGTRADGKVVARFDAGTLDAKSHVEVRTPWTLARLIQRPPTAEQAMRAPFVLEADVNDLPLPLPYTARLTDAGVLGKLTASVDLKGPPLAPIGKAKVRITGLTTGEADPMNVELEVDARKNAFVLKMRGEQKDRAILTAHGTLAGAPGDFRNPARAARVPLTLEMKVAEIPLALLQELGGSSVGSDRPAAQTSALSGKLSASLSAKGNLNDPTLSVRTSVDGVAAQPAQDVKKGPPAKTGKVTLAFDYQDEKARLATALRSHQGGSLELKAEAPIDLSYAGLQRGFSPQRTTVTASLRGKDFDPTFLSRVSPMLLGVSGLIQSDIRVKGFATAPTVEGELEWTHGTLALAGSGEMTEVHLALSGNQDRVVLEDFSARAGKGKAKLTAVATRAGPGYSLELKADVDQFPAIAEDQLLATVSIDASARGQLRRTSVEIRPLKIDQAHLELPDVKRKNLQRLDAPADVVFVRNGVPLTGDDAREPAADAAVGGSGPEGAGNPEAPPEGGPAPMKMAVFIDAPRDLWVKSSDMNIELGLAEGFRVESAGESTLVFGEVRILRGRLDVFGRRFDFEEGSKVRLTGPADQPQLDVTARHVNEKEGVTVLLKIRGEGERIVLQPTSQPPLSETQIYTLLATGRLSLRPGSESSQGSGNAAASLLGSAVASQLKSRLDDALPLDVLSIEAGESGVSGSKVEAGTYIGDRLYLGVTGRFGNATVEGENANSFNLEYQLSRRWSVEGEYGDASAGGVELLWKKEY